MDYKYYTLSGEDMESNANIVKDAVLAKLCRDGIISEEQYEELSATLAVIFRKPSALSRFARKILGKERADLQSMTHVVTVDAIWDAKERAKEKSEQKAE